MSNAAQLNLDDLGNGLPAITPAFGKAMAEAAGVCLESQSHAQNVQLLVSGYIESNYALGWPPVTEQALRTWNDSQEATEYGATAIAVLLARRELGYLVIERSPKGTGIDYWLGNESNELSFERKARLEVSGILTGSASDVRRRIRNKLRQTAPSDGQLSAFVVVVEFGTPTAEVRKK